MSLKGSKRDLEGGLFWDGRAKLTGQTEGLRVGLRNGRMGGL